MPPDKDKGLLYCPAMKRGIIPATSYSPKSGNMK
jgi:hypothetical protein